MANQYTDTFTDPSAPRSIAAHPATFSGKAWIVSSGAMNVTTGHNAVRNGTLGGWDLAVYNLLAHSQNEECSVDVNFGTVSPFVAGTDYIGVGLVARMSAPTGGTGYAAYIDVNPSNTYISYGIGKITGGTLTGAIGTEPADPTVTVAQITSGAVKSIRLKFYFTGAMHGATGGSTLKIDRSLDGGVTWTNVRTQADSTYTNAGYCGIISSSTRTASDTVYERMTNFNLGPVSGPFAISPAISSGYIFTTQGDAYNGLAFGYGTDGINFAGLFNGESQYADSTYGIRDPALLRWNNLWWVAYSPAAGYYNKTDSRRVMILSSPDLQTWTPVTTLGPTWIINGVTYTDANFSSDLYVDIPTWVIDATGLHLIFLFDSDPQLGHLTIVEVHPTAPNLSTWSNPIQFKDYTTAVIQPGGGFLPMYLGPALGYIAYENNVAGGNLVRRWVSPNLTSGWALKETFPNTTINCPQDIEPSVLTPSGNIRMYVDIYEMVGNMTTVQSINSIGNVWGPQVPMGFTGLGPITLGNVWSFAVPKAQKKRGGPSGRVVKAARPMLDFLLPAEETPAPTRGQTR